MDFNLLSLIEVEKLCISLVLSSRATRNPMRMFATSVQERDHYQTLGLVSTATAKQIKAAYYELSLKYHPDRHGGETEKQFAAQKFLEVAEAYETLGSLERRGQYDKARAERFRQQPCGSCPMHPANMAKNFEDLGLDYETFEEFQRNVNKRKQRRMYDHWQMPDEFYAEFGTRQFTNDYHSRRATTFTYSYKDRLQVERERREWEILKNIEEEKMRNKYKIPTFAAMERDRKLQKENARRQNNICITLFSVLLAFLFVQMRSH